MMRLGAIVTTLTAVIVIGVQLWGGSLPFMQSDRASGASISLPAAVGAEAVPEAGELALARAASRGVLAPDASDESASGVGAATCGTLPAGAVGDVPDSVPGIPTGTTTDDLTSFAIAFNTVRLEHCLAPIPMANFGYDDCMQQRLTWIAEDPSTDPTSAWGHDGTPRSDAAVPVGCDGNLAGGSNNDGMTLATKWWDSDAHRASLYRPDFAGSTSDVCIAFAATHGGVPDEPASFLRAAARWTDC